MWKDFLGERRRRPRSRMLQAHRAQGGALCDEENIESTNHLTGCLSCKLWIVEKWRMPLFFLKNSMNLAENTEKNVKERVVKVMPAELSLHKLAFFHSKGNTRIVIELDKESDPFGSVNVGECERVARALRLELDDMEKSTGINLNYSLEISSAGAERELKTPSEVKRFSRSPMNATYVRADGKTYSDVLKAESIEGDLITFRLADCKTNRKRYSPKKLREATAEQVSWSNIRKIHLHLDV